MKFSIQRNEMYEALQKVASVIPQRSTITMTQNVLINAADNRLELTTTDLEITMISYVNTEVQEEGAIAVPGRLIHDIVRELPDVLLTFESDYNHRLQLRSEFGEYKIGGENPAEFPQHPQLMESREFTLPNDVLRRLINNTIFACSTDELRPALTGVYFELGAGSGENATPEIRAIATDGHRLGFMKYTAEELPSEPLKAIISTRALNFVLRNIETDGMTAVLLGDKHALFHMDNTRLYARLIEDVYVDYHRVIPEETNYEMIIDTDGFFASVRRVSLFSNPLSAQVILQIEKNKVVVHAEDADYGGEASEELPCEFSGDSFTIGFNSRYLQDVLKHVESPQVLLQFVRPEHAVKVRPTEVAENHDQLMLLMPIRLEND